MIEFAVLIELHISA